MMNRLIIFLVITALISLIIIVYQVVDKYFLQIEQNVIHDAGEETCALQHIMQKKPTFLQYRKALRQSCLLRNEPLYRSFEYYTFLKETEEVTKNQVPTGE